MPEEAGGRRVAMTSFENALAGSSVRDGDAAKLNERSGGLTYRGKKKKKNCNSRIPLEPTGKERKKTKERLQAPMSALARGRSEASRSFKGGGIRLFQILRKRRN